jgi:hypothetical protein
MTDIRNEAVETLTEAEVKRLETVVKEEEAKAARDELRKKYKEYFRKQTRQQSGIDEGIEEVYIDVAKHSDGITIDGIKYQHGHTYKVKASLAADLRWIMRMTYEHQSEVDGKTKTYYNTARNTVLGPQGVINRSQLLRV